MDEQHKPTVYHLTMTLDGGWSRDVKIDSSVIDDLPNEYLNRSLGDLFRRLVQIREERTSS